MEPRDKHIATDGYYQKTINNGNDIADSSAIIDHCNICLTCASDVIQQCANNVL